MRSGARGRHEGREEGAREGLLVEHQPFPSTSHLIYAVLSMGDFFRDLFADQLLRPIRERELVRQAAFEEHTDAGMP
jgi:hypothetical protein